MGILENILAEPGSDGPEPVELVTLPSDATAGPIEGHSRRFPDLEAALECAHRLPRDEQEASFIRTQGAVQTIEKAEATLDEEADVSD
jgi:hypothetical protein